MKKSLSLILGLVIGLYQFSSAQTSEKRETAAFTGVSIGSGLTAYVSQGAQMVELKGDKDYLKKVTTTVKDNILYVNVDNIGLNWNFGEKVKIYISTPEFSYIGSSGGADVFSGNIIKSKDLKLKCSGGADLKLEVEANKIMAESSGGADMELRGKTEILDAECSGGADIDAADLVSASCTARASGGADIKVHATKSLEAKASGGADIYYKGNPEKLNKSESGGGDISTM
ncbi:head GIN domain-containing protein [Cytophagales bacterium LB-30]|uniref:Head GIN domain-containing protein n=1 Tax=Shiella aurantiaca TaxID=3058365 RepID=A0ABT8F8T4_9BACT|nr:head GIN domain-containing protein [Shiella aurantiaca]MDN4166793.1 head GIN domain-containing protein [Shiella aurantiaca]